MMRVFLLKDIEKVGMAGEIVKVADGFGRNYLISKKLGVEVTDKNEKGFLGRIKSIEKRQEVISTQTSMLAEKVKNTEITIKRKTHDNGKLYGSINPSEIVELLAQKGISVSKSQIKIDKAIKSLGTHDITIKLSSKLKPSFRLKIVQEKENN